MDAHFFDFAQNLDEKKMETSEHHLRPLKFSKYSLVL